jgi:hypothetical protein
MRNVCRLPPQVHHARATSGGRYLVRFAYECPITSRNTRLSTSYVGQPLVQLLQLWEMKVQEGEVQMRNLDAKEPAIKVRDRASEQDHGGGGRSSSLERPKQQQ